MARSATRVNYQLDYEYFKMILSKRKITIKDIAKIIDVDHSILGHKLRKRDIQISYVFAILDVLEIPFDEIFKPVKINKS